MAIQLTAFIPSRNKEVEALIVAAAKHVPVATAGGKAKPRELTFQLRSKNDAIATRMRIYLHMKKIGQEVKVKIAGVSYKKPAAEAAA
jgi:hypothetical protein